jgi:hypothetical protein
MMSDDRCAIGREVHMDNSRPRVGNGVEEQTKADLGAQIRRGAEEAEGVGCEEGRCRRGEDDALEHSRRRDPSEKWIGHRIGAERREDLGCPLLGCATEI